MRVDDVFSCVQYTLNMGNMHFRYCAICSTIGYMKKFCILTVCIFALFFNHSAQACSPAPGWPIPLEEQYIQSPTVFVGTVQSVVQDKSIYGDYRIMFDIAKGYKNTQAGTTQVIMVRGSSAACGYDDAYSMFPIGSVWAIYADETFGSSSLSQNTKYNSITEAIVKVDAIAQEEKPTICPMHYAPVCGRIDTGIRCITTPCDSTEDITYGNSCMLQGSGAEFLYEGECKDETPLPPQKPVVNKPVVHPPIESPTPTPTVPPTDTVPSPIEDPAVTQESWWSRFITGLGNIIFFWK